MRKWISVLCFCIALGTHGANAKPHTCDLTATATATVSSVEDGETLVLQDGRQVRLLGILAPAEPPDWEGAKAWPFAVRAQQALAQLVEGELVSLAFDTRGEDRYGHFLAHVYVATDREGFWLQERLVARGLARVAAQPDLSACLAPLLAVEASARQARRGIWRSLTYQVRDAHDPKALGFRRHTYQLVEGHVHGIGEGKKRVYINFAEDWRQDFTIVIARKQLPVLEANGLDLMGLPGRRIRVRGWLEWWNGPMIEVSHAEEIEVLDASAAADQAVPSASE